MRLPTLRAWPTRSAPAAAGSSILLVLLLFALVGPALARHGPFESDFVHGLSPDQAPVGPSLAFPLGADRLFRDVLARLAYGARLSLFIAVSATALAVVLGTGVGMISGWYERTGVPVPWTAVAAGTLAAVAASIGHPTWGLAAVVSGAASLFVHRFAAVRIDVDGWLMRLVDVLLAFPFLLLVMSVGNAFDRTTPLTVLLTLGATGWPGIARLVRAKTLQVRSLEYIEASRALGQSIHATLLRHVLPNVGGTIIVSATVLAGQMIIADSVLSYLGVGISPPAPTWGRMLFEGQDDLTTAPWLVAAPGAAIVLAVSAFNMLGEGLRDALDPTGR